MDQLVTVRSRGVGQGGSTDEDGGRGGSSWGRGAGMRWSQEDEASPKHTAGGQDLWGHP